MTLDLTLLREASPDRMGDVLLALGAKVVGSSARGRASCPGHGGDGLNLAFANGLATCHSGCGGKTYDALGLVAAVEGLDLRVAEDLRIAAHRLAEILGIRIDEEEGRPAVRRAAAPRPAPRPAPAPYRDAAAIWRRLTLRDTSYLAGRGLVVHPMPDDLVRSNVDSGDPWLEARARDGYGIAFAARRPDGSVATLSLRYTGQGEAPSTWKKSPTLAGCSTAGAAICRAGIALLATGDPEFARDELVLVEGGPDALAVTIAFGGAALEGDVPPTWALGAIGCGSAPATLRAFAQAVKGRTVHVALDSDEKGEEWAVKAITAAWEVGAARVTRLRPPTGKDVAGFVAGVAA